MSNILTREFFFFHDGQNVSCEAEYIVDLNPDRDGVKVIGEITNDGGEVFEIKDKVVCAQMRSKFWDDIEDIRRELVWEKSSKLRDFNKGGVYHMPLPEEGIVT